MNIGKGMYLWIINRVEGGDPVRIAEVAKAAGLRHVLIKVADGPWKYNVNSAGVDAVGPMVDALRARGIAPWGWQYIYGDNPAGEAAMAIQRVKQFNLDGFVVNAEKEFKVKGMETAANQYMTALRAGLPQTPLGFSSYRYPSLHRPVPFEVFLRHCQVNMPQVYWQLSSNPRQQLEKSVNEYRMISSAPIVPTGTAYPEGNWKPTPEQEIAFLQASRDFELGGANWWEWYYARKDPGLWQAISNFPWPPAVEPPRKDEDEGQPPIPVDEVQKWHKLQEKLKAAGLPHPI